MKGLCNEDLAALRHLGEEAKNLQAADDTLVQQLIRLRHNKCIIHARGRVILNRRAPISRLPNEIMGIIFEHGVVQCTSGRIPFEILVSHVSHHWREVALSTPQIWTDIEIMHMPEHTALLDLYLQRSRTCLIDVSSGDGWSRSSIHFERLIQHCHRWRTFSAHDMSPSDAPLFVELNVPNLRSLDIAIEADCQWVYEPDSPQIRMFRGGAPLLSVLRIDSNIFSAGPFPGLTALKELRLGGEYDVVPFEHLREALVDMKVLEKLAFHCCEVRFPASPTPVVLPSLKKLHLDAVTSVDDYLVPFALALLTPSLEYLGFRSSQKNQLDRFARCVQASTSPQYPRLHRLKLRDTYASVELMRALPGITHLVVISRQDAYEENILAVLSQSSLGPSPVWPSLQSVTLEEVPRGVIQKLAAMARARLRAGCPVQKLILVSSGARFSDSPQDVAWLRENVDLQLVKLKDNGFMYFN
ncbi:hypothetical protein PLICRDRAFT_176946 [Plicaturopsis crispa FD-325 SS-3]|nr:hypothetical protein PLICRDRAFT_176946 [Plicaturopsis crispa FD-325 SS-3]